MTTKPIIFNAEMVRAILDGRKFMTRRIIKPQPVNPKWSGSEWIDTGCDDTKHFALKCPYKVGVNLWVRETFALLSTSPTGAYYRADYDEANVKKAIKKGGSSGWKPSIFMPRKLSRISLEIVDVRVEKLQDIKPEDAIREGYPFNAPQAVSQDTYIDWFKVLWDSINKKRGYGWAENPWVFVISFKRIT